MLNIQENIPLAKMTTFRIGGPARYFFQAEDIAGLAAALDWAKQEKVRTFILGGGSNVLFPDQGFDGLVIQLSAGEIMIKKEENGIAELDCPAGVALGVLVKKSIENGLAGLVWAAGIPGSVGGAIRGNAGAFGGQMNDKIVQVQAINITKPEKIEKFDNLACQFGYRSSRFMHEPGWLIWSAVFVLPKGDPAELKKEMVNTLEKRREKQPDPSGSGCAGSFFKNPVVSAELVQEFQQDKELKWEGNTVPAGWLIDRCDLKGKKIGGAFVDPKHANFIMNDGTASSRDVIMLASIIKQKVRNHFHVQLQEEVEIVL